MSGYVARLTNHNLIARVICALAETSIAPNLLVLVVFVEVDIFEPLLRSLQVWHPTLFLNSADFK